MRGFSTAFSIIVLVFLGIYLIAVAIGWTSPDQAGNLLRILGEERAIAGIVGVVCLAIGYLLLHLTLRRFSREPSMAFQNPDGEVRVAFSAIEDFIKRLGGKLTEVREMHPQVLATREGLEIYNRIILEPNTNIPEATSRIQEMIRKYVEDVLGIKDIIAIKVLVVKIASEEGRKKKVKEEPMLPEVEVRE
ncbi:MAG: alkaline shock response membrane anchor protein AmaP [Nitrospirae bacterium]|nr:alkaline shock response membrane anchor protein AmaP [Nitrospirota bacterium]